MLINERTISVEEALIDHYGAQLNCLDALGYNTDEIRALLKQGHILKEDWVSIFLNNHSEENVEV